MAMWYYWITVYTDWLAMKVVIIVSMQEQYQLTSCLLILLLVLMIHSISCQLRKYICLSYQLLGLSVLHLLSILVFAISLKYVELKNKRKAMKNYKDINKFKASVLDSVKEELSKLSPIKRWLFETLFDKIWAIFSDECSETEISSAINSLEKVNSEYVRPTDVLNYDESMRVLNFSNNRVGFKRLMDAKGIEQVIFKNRKIGYRKSEILALKSELEAEQKAKKAKEKPYKQNKAVNKKPRLSNMEKMY
nr:MAG TPA: hypothetical protein [Caudoviricetes sp.]